jgi:ABC-type maltose transport system permease subunit
MAGALIPVILLFVAAQRYFVNGLMGSDEGVSGAVLAAERLAGE